MAQFILMLHENPAHYADITPEEMQQMVAQYGAWGKKLAEQGRYVGGHKLTDEGGKQMRKQRGALAVTDGPYSELKEIVGGLYIIEAPDYDSAVAIASDCPHLDNGWIEVRQIDRP